MPKHTEISEGQSQLSPPSSKGVLSAVVDYLKTKLDPYFATKNFESNGEIYRALGIKEFKSAILKLADLIGISRPASMTSPAPAYFLSGRTQDSLNRAITNSKYFEIAHIGAILLTNLPTFFQTIIGADVPTSRLLIVGAAFALNCYCICLARYNRSRLTQVLSKINRNSQEEV